MTFSYNIHPNNKS